MIGRAILLAVLLAKPAGAFELPEGAVLTAESYDPRASARLPTGPWSADGTPANEGTGALSQRAWRIPQTGLTTDQLLDPIREALIAEGDEVLFECADRACGGFDFRYALDLLPEPDMHVDLGDYRYLTAISPNGTLTAVVTSRGGGAGYIHITRLGDSATTEAPPVVQPSQQPPQPEAVALPEVPDPPGSIAQALREHGHAVLADLEFAPGSSELEARAFPSLTELAVLLDENPDMSVILVGHSDNVGSLEANIELSRRRAAAVVERLIEAHDVAPGQLAAEGIGFLSPIAPNTTDEGRALNRRVEVILGNGQ